MKLILLLTLSAIMFMACGKGNTSDNGTATYVATPSEINTDLIVATGRVEPEIKIIKLSAPEAGIIKSVAKQEGSVVAKGELLVCLEDDVEQSRTKEIQAEIETQQTQAKIEKAEIAEVQTNLSYKTKLKEKAKRLFENGAETQQVLDDLDADIDVLEAQLTQRQAKIQAVYDKINELKMQLNTARLEWQKKRFYAPFNGQLLTLTVQPGESVAQYASYAEFAPEGDYIVRAEVDELFASKIKKGQKADIVYNGSDKLIATGEITYVAPYLKKKSLFSEKSDEQEDRRVREVKISLKNKNDLIINSKVECKIKL